jgi:hypothetical protein
MIKYSLTKKFKMVFKKNKDKNILDLLRLTFSIHNPRGKKYYS